MDKCMCQDLNMFRHSNIEDCIQLKLDLSFTIIISNLSSTYDQHILFQYMLTDKCMCQDLNMFHHLNMQEYKQLLITWTLLKWTEMKRKIHTNSTSWTRICWWTWTCIGCSTSSTIWTTRWTNGWNRIWTQLICKWNKYSYVDDKSNLSMMMYMYTNYVHYKRHHFDIQEHMQLFIFNNY